MSTKQGSARAAGSVKILNDERISTVSLPVMTCVPLSPNKRVAGNTSNGGPKSARLKKMDHYVLKTIKGEADEEGVVDETIDFILADNEDTPHDGLGGPSGEITEEVHLEGDAMGGDEKTEEIVEHVCGKCYKSFRRINGLKKHLDFCRFDSGYHLRKAEMLKNLEKIEKDAAVMENKDICFCCGESYDTFHLGHINCPDCPKSFKTQMSYERHIFITHSESNEFPCTICNATLRSANLLKLHVDQHQNRGKPFACKICGKDFTRSYHLKRHQKYSSCSANENDSMNCKVCNKTFYRLDNLRAHLKQHLGTHTAKKPEYMCPICKNCFYSLSTLNIHTRTHTGERPFDCDLCEKKFPSLVALKKHRRYHTGEKPYTCSVCNQSFAVKEVLNRHMKRHTGERPHVCKECGKSFIQATQLRSHSRTHIRPFECDECDEKFKTEKGLDRHAKTHNKGRKRKRLPEFKCKECSVIFRKMSQLEKHLKRGKHIRNEGRGKAQKERTDCSICDKNFDTAKNLHFHILKVHEVDPEDFINVKPSDDEAVKLPAPKIYKVNEKADGPTIVSISDDPKDADFNEENRDSNENDDGVVVQEFIVDEMPATSSEQTIILQNETFTVIPLDSVGIIETVTAQGVSVQVSPEIKKGVKKSLGESLAAAIADDVAEKPPAMISYTPEDLIIKTNVRKLLDMLVDEVTLKKYGWPATSEEIVLCKVIENCGHDLTKESENLKNCEYATRMREYVKLLFTVVIHNDSIKELLNNYSIDEVIEYVLGNDDDEDEAEEGENSDDNNS